MTDAQPSSPQNKEGGDRREKDPSGSQSSSDFNGRVFKIK